MTDLEPDARSAPRRRPPSTVRALAVVGVAAALAGLLAACSSSSAEVPPAPTRTSSATTTPSAEPTPTTEPATSISVRVPSFPETFSDQELIDLYEQPLPAALQPLQDMTPEVFVTQPVAQRESYCSWLNRDRQYVRSQFAEGLGDNSVLVSLDVDESSDDQQLVTNSFGGDAVVKHYGGGQLPTADARKLLSCEFLNPSFTPGGQDAFNRINDQIFDGMNSPTPIQYVQGGFYLREPVVGSTPFRDFPSGDAVFRAKDVTLTVANGSNTTITVVLIPYTDYLGQPRQTAVTVLP